MDAWERRDPSFDGVFVLGVVTTGIFCRPSCPSRPSASNLEFFNGSAEAVAAGFRPCKRCKPDQAQGVAPEWARILMDRVMSTPQSKPSGQMLEKMGLTKERVRRWFQQNHGMSFVAWARTVRLSSALRRLNEGSTVDDAVFDSGFDSHSGFRSAFARVFKQPPGQSQHCTGIHVSLIESPIGTMLAAADDTSLCRLEFADRRTLQESLDTLSRDHRKAVIPIENEVLSRLGAQLQEYFTGRRTQFEIATQPVGTPFQKRVWAELIRIPYGTTASYEQIAERLGKPTATRAVAQANAKNPIYLLVPCHRVISKAGSLSGYGGGVWRKRALLRLETTGKCGPSDPTNPDSPSLPQPPPDR